MDAGFGRSDESAADQKLARENLKEQEIERVMEQQEIGYDEAAKVVSNYVALHDPDQVVGGDGEIVSLGVGSINYSIGAQWKNKIHQVDSVVEKATRHLDKEELSKMRMKVQLQVGK